MVVKITPTPKDPHGKVADVELQFTDDEPLAGLKLVGFAVWMRNNDDPVVTFPARQYSVNGTRHSFAMLRPIFNASKVDRLQQQIIAAYFNATTCTHCHGTGIEPDIHNPTVTCHVCKGQEVDHA